MRKAFETSELLPTMTGRFVNMIGLSVIDPESADDETDEEEEEEIESMSDEASIASDVDGNKINGKGVRGGDIKVKNSLPKTPKPVIAVDDMSTFKMLEPVLKELKLISSICWIDGCTISSNSSLEFVDEEVEYDTKALEKDSILNLSMEEFRVVVNIIPDKTFKAPKTTVSLFNFLKIPSLSKLVKEHWTQGDLTTPSLPSTSRKDSSPSPTAVIISNVNALLEVAQRILFKNGRGDLCELLIQSSGFQSLFDLKVLECFDLRRQLSLNLSSFGGDFIGVIAEAEQSMPYHRDSDTAKPLLVSASILHTELLQMCIDLIMRPLRIEIALKDTNQRLDLIKDVSLWMTKFSKSPLTKFPDLFDHEEIPLLPDHITPWLLFKPIVAETAIEDNKEDEVDEADEVEEESKVSSAAAAKRREAYERLREDAQRREQSRQPLPLEPSTAEIFIDHEKNYLKEMNERHVTQSTEEISILLTSHHNQDQPQLTTPAEYSENDKETSLIVPFAQGQRIRALNDDSHLPLEKGKGEGSELVSEQRIRASNDDGFLPIGEGEGDGLGLGQWVGTVNADGFLYIKEGKGEGQGNRVGEAGRESDWKIGDRSSSTGSGNYNGNGFGGRTYEADSASFRPTTTALLSVDLTKVLSDQSLSSDFLCSISGFNANCSDTDISELILFDNAVTGRVGEYWASEYLTSQAASFGFISVEWLNKEEEKGLPYDIKIELAGGRFKYCEVKTRSFDSTKHVDINQWFISPKEVLLAQQVHKAM
jgi:hypothetical protein